MRLSVENRTYGNAYLVSTTRSRVRKVFTGEYLHPIEQRRNFGDVEGYVRIVPLGRLKSGIVRSKSREMESIRFNVYSPGNIWTEGREWTDPTEDITHSLNLTSLDVRSYIHRGILSLSVCGARFVAVT